MGRVGGAWRDESDSLDGVCLTEALKQAGFEIITQRDHSDFGVSLGGKKWWYMFEEGSRPLQILMDLVGKVLSMENMMWVAEKLRVVPPGTSRAHDLTPSLGAGMKDGGEQGIFTPMHYWLARNPSQVSAH